jgi:hypothetical protein
VFFDEAFAQTSDHKLTREQVYAIDTIIAGFNVSIRNQTNALNEKHGATQRYHVCDVNDALLRAAYRRNNENPPYPFPDPILRRFPKVDTRYYHANRKGSLIQGGLFSLDGVHPSAIGQGLLAHEFMTTINGARGYTKNAEKLKVDWDSVYASDDLYMKPLKNMGWLRDQEKLFRLFLHAVGQVVPYGSDPLG